MRFAWDRSVIAGSDDCDLNSSFFVNPSWF